MEEFEYLDDLEKIKYFLNCIKNSSWGLTASEKTLDNLLYVAVEIEKSFSQKNNRRLTEHLKKNYPDVKFEKSVELLMENVIKNQNLSENLTLYCIKKYIVLFSKNDFCELIENMLCEVKLRKYLFQLNEELLDVDLDWYSINNIISNLSSKDKSSKIYNIIKTQTSALLNAIRHSPVLKGQYLMEEVINCLEDQPDLKLWFIMFKLENMDVILYLCKRHNNFFQAVFRFFDKFADEVESNYDEDLNVKYCHVNLDFEDFIKVIELFLKDESVSKTVSDYLERKSQLGDKNFCFWIDVKACV